LAYVLTVLASIRDTVSIGDRHLFETRRLLEVLQYLYSSYFLMIYMHADAASIVIHSI